MRGRKYYQADIRRYNDDGVYRHAPQNLKISELCSHDRQIGVQRILASSVVVRSGDGFIPIDWPFVKPVCTASSAQL